MVTTKSTTDKTAFPIACTNTTCTVSQRPWRGILETKNMALVDKMHQLQKNDSVDLWGRLQGNMNKVVRVAKLALWDPGSLFKCLNAYF